MGVIFNIVSNDGEQSSVTAFVNGEAFVATSEHPNFDQIVDALLFEGVDDPREVADLFDVGAAISKKFTRVSERVLISGDRILFDGEEINDVLAQTIVRFHGEGNDDFKPLVAFLEKLASNPNPHSREHLYRWLSNESFVIASDGDFIAYKSVYGNDKDEYTSVSSGKAIVDGEEVTGHIPNNVGSIVEMPRNGVTFDPGRGCSTGLHAGTWAYASSFSGNVKLRVKINPRDVVSVPTDCADQKVRVCRYQVIERVDTDTPVTGARPDQRLLYQTSVPAPTTRRQDLEAENRDFIRKLAKTYGIPRKDRTKGELIDAILWAEGE